MEAPSTTFVVDTAEQLRALADPLRQRLLQSFAEPRTIKETAEKLGEPLTKLYHHVDQLLAAGLIRVVREERRRAVLERTFQASATRFAVSPAAFASGTSRIAKRERIARSALEEVLGAAADEEGAFRLLRSSARLSEDGLKRIESEIARLLRELDDPAAPAAEIVFLSVRRE
jgi:DNA-binding transcriptional ArsR family regulator